MHNYSLQYDLPELSLMYMINVENIIQHTQRLNITYTNQRRIRRVVNDRDNMTTIPKLK